MHDMLFIRTMIAMTTGRSLSEIFVYWPMDPIEPIIQDILRVPDGIFFIIGFDRPQEEIYVPLDHWLVKQDRYHLVFLLNEDFLHPQPHTRSLQRIRPLGLDHITLANLSWARQYEHMISRNFVTDRHTGKWLSLNRSFKPWRAYAKHQWLDRWPDCFLTSFGPTNFHGDFNFYDRIPNAPSYVSNSLNLLQLQNVYNSTCGSIVNESGGVTSYSEKVFHAILALHPVLLIAHPGLVNYLRQHGFDMFDDILDHSYDTIETAESRIDVLFSRNQGVIQKGIDRRRLRDRLLNNSQQVWNYYRWRLQDFENQLLNHLKGT